VQRCQFCAREGTDANATLPLILDVSSNYLREVFFKAHAQLTRPSLYSIVRTRYQLGKYFERAFVAEHAVLQRNFEAGSFERIAHTSKVLAQQWLRMGG
jgi:hypothetical protein